MRRLRVFFAGFVMLAFAGQVAGQSAFDAQQGPRVPLAPVLTIDTSRLLPETVVGQRLVQALEAEGAAIESENDRIAQDLREEELALTAQRDSLPREEFARLAEEFDAKVQQVRRDRDAIQASLQQRLEDQQRALFAEIQPILSQIMREAGAAVILEVNSVLISVRAVDITNVAIARINATLGPAEGTDATAPSESDD